MSEKKLRREKSVIGSIGCELRGYPSSSTSGLVEEVWPSLLESPSSSTCVVGERLLLIGGGAASSSLSSISSSSSSSSCASSEVVLSLDCDSRLQKWKKLKHLVAFFTRRALSLPVFSTVHLTVDHLLNVLMSKELKDERDVIRVQ